MAERKPITFVPREDQDAEDITGPDLTADEDNAFESYRQSFVGEEMGSIRVSRVPVEQMRAGQSKGSIKGAFLFTTEADRYTFDELLTRLRDEYGTGSYRITGVRSGQRGLAFNRIVDVERVASVVTPATVAASSEMAAIVSQMAALMERQTQQMAEILRPVVTAPVAAPVDPMEQFKQMLQLAAMMKSAFSGPVIAPPDLLTEIERFKKLSEIFKGGGSLDGDGEATGMGVFGKMIDVFGPPLVDAVKSGQIRLPTPTATGRHPSTLPWRDGVPGVSQGPLPGMASGSAPRTAPATAPAPEMEHEKTPVLSPVDQYRRSQVLRLSAFADSGANPDQIAATIIDSVSETELDALEPLAYNENAVNEMIVLAPECERHRAWFETFRLALHAGFEEMMEDSPEPGATDVQSNPQ